MQNQKVTTTASESRKTSKPDMEKKRRARINASLAELKSLLLDAVKREGTRHNKMEKADILELAVRHLKKLHKDPGLGQDVGSLLNKYTIGFHACAQEVGKYLTSSTDEEIQLKTKLMTHLANCMTNKASHLASSTSSTTPIAVTSSVMAEPPSSSSSSSSAIRMETQPGHFAYSGEEASGQIKFFTRPSDASFNEELISSSSIPHTTTTTSTSDYNSNYLLLNDETTGVENRGPAYNNIIGDRISTVPGASSSLSTMPLSLTIPLSSSSSSSSSFFSSSSSSAAHNLSLIPSFSTAPLLSFPLASTPSLNVASSMICDSPSQSIKTTPRPEDEEEGAVNNPVKDVVLPGHTNARVTDDNTAICGQDGRDNSSQSNNLVIKNKNNKVKPQSLPSELDGDPPKRFGESSLSLPAPVTNPSGKSNIITDPLQPVFSHLISSSSNQQPQPRIDLSQYILCQKIPPDSQTTLTQTPQSQQQPHQQQKQQQQQHQLGADGNQQYHQHVRYVGEPSPVLAQNAKQVPGGVSSQTSALPALIPIQTASGEVALVVSTNFITGGTFPGCVIPILTPSPLNAAASTMIAPPTLCAQPQTVQQAEPSSSSCQKGLRAQSGDQQHQQQQPAILLQQQQQQKNAEHLSSSWFSNCDAQIKQQGNPPAAIHIQQLQQEPVSINSEASTTVTYYQNSAKSQKQAISVQEDKISQQEKTSVKADSDDEDSKEKSEQYLEPRDKDEFGSKFGLMIAPRRRIELGRQSIPPKRNIFSSSGISSSTNGNSPENDLRCKESHLTTGVPFGSSFINNNTNISLLSGTGGAYSEHSPGHENADASVIKSTCNKSVSYSEAGGGIDIAFSKPEIVSCYPCSEDDSVILDLSNKNDDNFHNSSTGSLQQHSSGGVEVTGETSARRALVIKSAKISEIEENNNNNNEKNNKMGPVVSFSDRGREGISHHCFVCKVVESMQN